MDRREFLCCAAGGCVLALTGCAGLSGSKKAKGMREATASEKAAMEAGWDVSVCGLNCAKCKLLAKGECGGCRGPKDKHWSPGCEFLPCATEKGHRYCSECAEFPCDKMKAFAADGHKHHQLAVENLKAMREKGFDQWVAEQPKVMFCVGWFL